MKRRRVLHLAQAQIWRARPVREELFQRKSGKFVLVPRRGSAAFDPHEGHELAADHDTTLAMAPPSLTTHLLQKSPPFAVLCGSWWSVIALSGLRSPSRLTLLKLAIMAGSSPSDDPPCPHGIPNRDDLRLSPMGYMTVAGDIMDKAAPPVPRGHRGRFFRHIFQATSRKISLGPDRQ